MYIEPHRCCWEEHRKRSPNSCTYNHKTSLLSYHTQDIRVINETYEPKILLMWALLGFLQDTRSWETKLGCKLRECWHTMQTIANKTMLTKKRCCPFEHRLLHGEIGLISDISLVIAPHHPHLNIGANLGSTTRSPAPTCSFPTHALLNVGL